MYQIREATRAFGPIGQGWGWHSQTETVTMQNGDMAFLAHITIWHGNANNNFGPFTGCRTFYKKERIAEDAPKMLSQMADQGIVAPWIQRPMCSLENTTTSMRQIVKA